METKLPPQLSSVSSHATELQKKQALPGDTHGLPSPDSNPPTGQKVSHVSGGTKPQCRNSLAKLKVASVACTFGVLASRMLL